MIELIANRAVLLKSVFTLNVLYIRSRVERRVGEMSCRLTPMLDTVPGSDIVLQLAESKNHFYLLDLATCLAIERNSSL